MKRWVTAAIAIALLSSTAYAQEYGTRASPLKASHRASADRYAMLTAQVGNLFSGAIPGQQFNTQVFDCSSGFASSGSCGVSFIGGSGQPFAVVGSNTGTTPALSGSQVNLVTSGAGHVALSMIYQTKVNVQKFKATYTFIWDGWNISFVLNNSDLLGTGSTGKDFSAGAGCEGGFFQGFPYANTGSNNTGNVFALMLDGFSSLTAGGSTFTYSGTQWYATGNATPPNAPNPPGTSPCNPDLGGSGYTYVGVNKVSTSPVPLNSPVGSPNTATGDTFSVTITYDGSNLTEDLYDITAGGTCTPVTSVTCFHNVWTNVDIPTVVGANTAWVGLIGSTNTAAPAGLFIPTATYYTP